jgi:hypothetical protein
MRSRYYHRPEFKPFNPEEIEELDFSDCLNLIRELELLGNRELRMQENVEIIKKLENRIKYLGATKSYKYMAALPAVNALVS